MNKNHFIKKAIAGITALAAISSAYVPAMTTAPVLDSSAATVMGDVNSDGKINSSDVVQLQKYIIHQGELTQEEYVNADLNKDNKINAIDLTILKRQISTAVESNDVIHLEGTSISTESSNVIISGTKATITKSGNYKIDGSMTVDAQIIINTDTTDTDDVNITLDNVSMTNSTDIAAIDIENAEKTKITLIGNNTLTNTVDDANATGSVIDAKDDLVFTKNSTGTLNIVSNSQQGIEENNDLKFNGGTVNITTDKSGTGTLKSDGIKAKQTIENNGAIINIDASGDGIKSTKQNTVFTAGTTSIKAGNDAVQAETDINITGGNLIASGDRGLTSAGTLTVTGGTILATATDNQSNFITNASTQQIITLDYAAEHKKSENIKIGDKTFKSNKKYNYVLTSDSSFNGTVKVYTNDKQQKSDEATDGNFKISDSVAHFTNVTDLNNNSSDDNNSETAYYISYTGTSVELKNQAGNVIKSADNVTVDGQTVIVTKPGEYDVSGKSTDGQIIVNIDKTKYPKDNAGTNKVTLVFNNLDLSNNSKAPVYIESIDDEAAISLKKGTENKISDGTSHNDNYTNSDNETKTINAAIYARDDLKIKGKGTLTVNGNTEDGIVSTNDVKLWNGNINVTAVDDGIRGNDAVKIGDSDDTDFSGLNITVKTTKSGDGIKSTSTEDGKGTVTINGGTVDINSYADGIQAEQAFTMNNGDVNIYTYQGSAYTASGSNTNNNNNNPWGGGGMSDGNSNKTDISAKGIKAVGLYSDENKTAYTGGGTLTINGGNLTVDSSDDSLHAAGDITLNAGKLKLSSADDGVHSDNKLYIGGNTAGTDYSSLEVSVPKCYEGMEAVYIYQNNGSVYVVSEDDGYNAAGGSDSSGNNNNTGFGQGGFGGGGMGMNETFGDMTLAGGIVVCNSANGDHDAFDSNGNITITGGYYVANGQEPMDCGDGGYSITNNGGAVITMTAGNTNLNNRYTFADSSGNVLASVISGQGGSYAYSKDGITAYSGGTVSGGTNIATLGQSDIYVGGTIANGTTLTAGSGSSGNDPWSGGGNRPGGGR